MLPATTSPSPLSIRWTDRLAFEIALMMEGSGEPLTGIIAAHNLTPEEMSDIAVDPVFISRVDGYRTDIRENGLSFKLKARMQAEELLTTSYQLIHNADVSAAVRADLIKSTVRWAGLDSSKDGGSEVTNNNGIKITINLGESAPPMRVIENES